MRFEEFLVTPEIAQFYLDKNESNRNISKATVDAYARDMLAGAWVETGQNNICISKNGMLKDGQHRLAAVIKAGIPVRMIFAFDVEDNVTVYDRGRNRSTRDELKVQYPDIWAGIYDTSVIGAVSLYINLKRPEGGFSKVTTTDILQVIRGKEDWINSVYRAISSGDHNKFVNTRKSAFILAALIANKNGVGIHTINRFARIMKSGMYDSHTETAAIVMRNDVISKKIVSQHMSDQKKSLMAMERALYDFHNGVSRGKSYSNIKDYTWELEL